uniref:Solute carrier family 15 member 2 n=1 Tax=Scleropages formosus TaxID=113540 RepID=A0A8C9W0H8_SCLFO
LNPIQMLGQDLNPEQNRTLKPTSVSEFTFTFILHTITTKLCGTNYPLSIAFIVVNEFCERFSYYGMKAVLTLYFINYLHWDKDLSTAVYHAFSSLCYFTPVLGALIADSWLGRFKTIIYLSLVYVLGHVVKSTGAIPAVGENVTHVVLSMTGLVLIAFGTGGIKPCVAAFGGDQFEKEHTEERRKFFSIFYMAINAGSLLSTIITPILRGDVQCFGGDCYALAFGVPAALMIIALVVFVAGSTLYTKSPPGGNVLLDVCKCIGFALRNRWRNSSREPRRAHWLDWAQEKYSKRLIYEIKMVLRVLVLFIPLPMFWALFDQQFSILILPWLFCFLTLSCQMLNSLLILVFVPIFDMILYPLIGLCKIKFITFSNSPWKSSPMTRYLLSPALSSLLIFTCSYSLFPEVCVAARRGLTGLSVVSARFVNTLPESLNVSVAAGVDFEIREDFGVSAAKSVARGQYKEVRCNAGLKEYSVDLGLLDFGASYTIVLKEGPEGLRAFKMLDIQANDVHITWQIPQYVLITAAEVMFSVTGLEFSYSQAPPNMKSVVQAGWLLTVAFGNVIVLIVAEGAGLKQWMEFLLFASLLIVVCIIFSIMAHLYTYVSPEHRPPGDGNLPSRQLSRKQ